MKKFFAANLRYPETIDELMEYRFIAKRDIPLVTALEETIQYVPHNSPYIAPVLPSSILTQAYDLKQSRYIISLPVAHIPNAQIFTRDENTMKIMMRTYDYIARQQKLSGEKFSSNVGWYVSIGKAK